MANEQKISIPIAYRAFTSRNLLKVTALLEQNGFLKDVIFLEFQNQIGNLQSGLKYDKENGIKILYNAIELRSLAIAMKNAVSLCAKRLPSERIGYRKDANSGTTKTVTIGYNITVKDNMEIESFFINILMNGKKLGVSFSKYDFMSFAKSLENIADETELMLYKAQRQLKKLKNKEIKEHKK